MIPLQREWFNGTFRVYNAFCGTLQSIFIAGHCWHWEVMKVAHALPDIQRVPRFVSVPRHGVLFLDCGITTFQVHYLLQEGVLVLQTTSMLVNTISFASSKVESSPTSSCTLYLTST